PISTRAAGVKLDSALAPNRLPACLFNATPCVGSPERLGSPHGRRNRVVNQNALKLLGRGRSSSSVAAVRGSAEAILTPTFVGRILGSLSAHLDFGDERRGRNLLIQLGAQTSSTISGGLVRALSRSN